MKKNILLIDTRTKNLLSLKPLLTELENRNYSFSLMTACPTVLNKYRLPHWHHYKLPCLFNLNRHLSLYFFLLLSPLLLIVNFFFILYLKYSQKIKTFVCCYHLEKLLFTKLGRLLKLNVVWLEFPGSSNQVNSKLLRRLLKNYSRFAKLIVFSAAEKEKLIKNNYKAENIHIILPGIKQKSLERQADIFNELAYVEKKQTKRNFFTIGIISELESEKLGDRLEKFFQAIKKSLSVIPNLQIIVVGEGTERKNLGWMTKKMEIDNLVWFVGGTINLGLTEQKHLKKWLDSFNLFVSVSADLDLNDAQIALHALESGLPVIGPDRSIMEDIIENNETGILINASDSEILTQKIIHLQQNKNLRKNLGEKARINTQKNFNIQNMASEFSKLI